MAKTKQKPAPPAGHYTDMFPCDARMRRSVAKLLRAGVPLDYSTALAVSETLPEAAIREIMRHELDRDLSQLYERLLKRN